MFKVPVGSWLSLAPQYFEESVDPPQVALDPVNEHFQSSYVHPMVKFTEKL